MHVTLSVSCDDLTLEDLQCLTRDLCIAIDRETNVQATLAQEAAVTGARGGEIAIGTILLTFLTSGSAVALFSVLKSYFDRNSSVELEFAKEGGGTLKITAHNMRPGQIQRTLESARQFLGGS